MYLTSARSVLRSGFTCTLSCALSFASQRCKPAFPPLSHVLIPFHLNNSPDLLINCNKAAIRLRGPDYSNCMSLPHQRQKRKGSINAFILVPAEYDFVENIQSLSSFTPHNLRCMPACTSEVSSVHLSRLSCHCRGVSKPEPAWFYTLEGVRTILNFYSLGSANTARGR